MFLNKGERRLSQLSAFLKISSSSLSQIITGNRHFSELQVFKVSEYFKFTKDEEEIFFLLYKENVSKSIEGMNYFKKARREKKVQPRNKVNFFELNDDDARYLYGKWYVTAIHLLTGISEFQTVSTLSRHLKISKEETLEALDFLEKIEFCQKSGAKYIHVEKSTLIKEDRISKDAHRLNWRLRGVNKMQNNGVSNEDIFVSYPMLVKKKNIKKIMMLLKKLVTDVSTLDSTHGIDNDCMCLNIDYFKFS